MAAKIPKRPGEGTYYGGEVAAHQKVFLAIQFVYFTLPGLLRSVPDLTNVFLTSSQRK